MKNQKKKPTSPRKTESIEKKSDVVVPRRHRTSGTPTNNENVIDVRPKTRHPSSNGDDTDDSSLATSSSSSMPPESEWDESALALKKSMDSGAFDHLLTANKDCNDKEDGSIEEIDIEDDESGDEVETDESGDETEIDSKFINDHNVDDDVKDDSENEAGDDHNKRKRDEDSEEESNHQQSQQSKLNNVNSNALHVVVGILQSQKREWPWAETFDVISRRSLPFEKNQGNAESEIVNVHDDLKREMAFYDMALESVAVAREKCQQVEIPFTRCDDFFAEMVKTDDHMAKVKDRLIFETKKMDAVTARKSSKEIQLRAKEAQSNKLAAKAKRKREHFEKLQDWAQSTASKRGRLIADDDDADNDRLQRFMETKSSRGRTSSSSGSNKTRQWADKKFGFGGKRGRFKQNDRKSLNDMSSFNPRGSNFSGGQKWTSPASAARGGGDGGRKTTQKRPGKRARDANRSKRS